MSHPRRAREKEETEDVLVTATIPPEEFGLSETFSRVHDASVRCESTVECGDSVLPLLRVRSSRPDELDAALREDPTTERVRRLADRGESRLYRVSWSNRVRFPVELLTAEDAAILDVVADSGEWTFRMLFPSRRALGTTVETCEEYGVSIELRKIGGVDDDADAEYGLTDTQYDSLRLAAERGYYNIPRSAKLDDLADEAGVSHQAYSERLRRATGSLLEQTLLDAHAPTTGGR